MAGVFLSRAEARCLSLPGGENGDRNGKHGGDVSARSPERTGWIRQHLGWPHCTGPSTNASCQPEKPENWYEKTWGSASTPGVSLHPRAVSFPTGETAGRARTRGMWRIRASVAASAAVKIMGVGIWYAVRMAPRHGFEPRFSAPKAAVLPLDDRGLAG